MSPRRIPCLLAWTDCLHMLSQSQTTHPTQHFSLKIHYFCKFFPVLYGSFRYQPLGRKCGLKLKLKDIFQHIFYYYRQVLV